MTSIDPEREQFEEFKSLPRDIPISMLNLISLNEYARYEDNRKVSGADAYKAYGRESHPIFQRVGGKIIWRGEPASLLIGPEDEKWHIAFIARYPHAGAFLEMVTDPEYQIAVHHRQAAVFDSRLIRCHEMPLGDETFG
jgi:uncharacterized protein (DUF1330 family)